MNYNNHLDSNTFDEDDDEALIDVALGQKLAIYAIILTFACGSVTRDPRMIDLAVFLGLFVHVMSLIGIWKMTGYGLPTFVRGLLMLPSLVVLSAATLNIFQNPMTMIGGALLMLIILIGLSIRATMVLRQAGYEVGLFGVKYE